MTIARTWAAFGRATTALPADVAARARLCLADHLHAAMHGARSETGAMLRQYLAARRDAEASALYLGATSAVHEIDDVHEDTSLHPGSVVVAAALAAARDGDIGDARFLAAIGAGYEIAVRLSIAAGHRHYHYFHATATCGTVGAAVAAAIVQDLDEEAIANAIGIAATSASGLWEGINDEAVRIKHLHPGMAAERGVRAASLARSGLRAADRAIEGDKGFLAALAQPGGHAANEHPSAQHVETILSDRLGQRWAILRNIFKRYPFCLGCFEPLEGIRYLLRTNDAKAVARVDIEASPSVAWMVGNPDPQDEFQAKFSAPFAMGLVLAGHDAERPTLSQDSLCDPQVRRWLPDVHVHANAEFGRRRARVTLTRHDGTSASTEQPFRNLEGAEAWARFALACDRFGVATLPRAVERGAVRVVIALVDAATG